MSGNSASARTERLRLEAEAELRSILAWWLRYVIDSDAGRIRGRVHHDNRRDPDAPLSSVLCNRILWTFAAASRRWNEAAWREAAGFVWSYFTRHFADREHGGVYWSLDPQGRALETRKQIYGQAFAVLALAEYHLATANPEPLEQARRLFHDIEAHSRDPVCGGYFEAYSREWRGLDDVRLSDRDLNSAKTMNTHLHLLEAFTNLADADPQNLPVRKALGQLVELFLGRIVRPGGRHLGLFFDECWRLESEVVSFGHDIEASWLLDEAAAVLGDSQLLGRVREVAMSLAEATLEEGVADDGSVLYERFADGRIDDDRHWWPQAEALVGFLNAWQISRQDRFLTAADRLWTFIKDRMVNRSHGEWYWRVDRQGRADLDDDKAGFWKCPYHNSRACLELIRRLS